VFTTRLTEADWDDTVRGWRCPALAVPGAVIEALYVDGTRVDSAKYEVLTQNTLIRWTLPDQPQRATASVKLTEELTLGTETDRWRKLAIVLPVVATIVSAALTGAATYFSKLAPDGRTPPSATGVVPHGERQSQIQPPSPTTLNDHITRAKELKLGETEPGVAIPDARWFKFSTDDKKPGAVRVLVRNVNLSGPIETQVFDPSEVQVKSAQTWDRSFVFEFTSMRPDQYYVMDRTFGGIPKVMPAYELLVTER
jgi:hypothetical protein